MVLLLASCILVEARMPGKNRNKKQRVTRGRHSERGERVWHVAGSAEECGDASATLYQSHDKPHDLCNEVSFNILKRCENKSSLQEAMLQHCI